MNALYSSNLNTKDYLVQNQENSKNILGVKNQNKNTQSLTENVFASRLKETRLRAGLSQEQLGILVGIDEFSASARVKEGLMGPI